MAHPPGSGRDSNLNTTWKSLKDRLGTEIRAIKPRLQTNGTNPDFKLPTRRDCACGCGGASNARSYFLPDHDLKALRRVIKREYGSVSEFLRHHDYSFSIALKEPIRRSIKLMDRGNDAVNLSVQTSCLSLSLDADGVACVGGTRVTLVTVIGTYKGVATSYASCFTHMLPCMRRSPLHFWDMTHFRNSTRPVLPIYLD